MSTYINFNIKVEEKDKEITLASFTGSSEIFEVFYPYRRPNGETPIDNELLGEVINDLRNHIKSCDESQKYWEKEQSKALSVLPGLIKDYSHEALNFVKDYIEEFNYSEDIEGRGELKKTYEECLAQVYFIQSIYNDMGWSDVKEFYFTIS